MLENNWVGWIHNVLGAIYFNNWWTGKNSQVERTILAVTITGHQGSNKRIMMFCSDRISRNKAYCCHNEHKCVPVQEKIHGDFCEKTFRFSSLTGPYC